MKIKKLNNKFYLNLYAFTKKLKNNKTTNTHDNFIFLKKSSFKQHFTKLLVGYSVIKLTNQWKYKIVKLNNAYKLNIINYYTTFFNKNTSFFSKHENNNLVVFSRPRNQLFFVVFKNKPVFIFTCGLMKYVINEKKKNAKKLYKVALSLLKLSSVIISNENHFNNFFLKLNNIGTFQSKILKTFINHKNSTKIKYTVIKNNTNTYSQKLSTRRSIKKYVKKRFTLP